MVKNPPEIGPPLTWSTVCINGSCQTRDIYHIQPMPGECWATVCAGIKVTAFWLCTAERFVMVYDLVDKSTDYDYARWMFISEHVTNGNHTIYAEPMLL